MISGEKQDKQLPSISALVGEYTTYTLVWSYSANPHGIANLYISVDNLGNVYATEPQATPSMLHIDYNGNATLYASDVLVLFDWIHAFSVDKKFHVGINSALVNDRLTVWRYGAQIFIRDPTLDYATFGGFDDVCMSPNGRFIAIVGIDTATLLRDIILLYEGS